MLKVYVYKNCSTCRNALNYLDERGVTYQSIPIREQPPTIAELKRMAGYLDGGSAKLFSTSGRDYREQDLKSQLPNLSDTERFQRLHANGNLVKRPFVIGKGIGTVGFKREVWDSLLV